MEDQLQQKRFLWGVALALTPWVPTLIGLAKAFRGIEGTKATGLAAVAGGVAEEFVVWGVGAVIIGSVTAIVLLVRSFSRAHWMRNVISVASLCLSGLMLLGVGLFLWILWFHSAF
jgi:hypothetical protein